MENNVREQVKLRLNPKQQDGLTLDVAIIGAGVSGLYAGWRLLSSAQKKGGRVPLVHIFEMSNRIGGRLESIGLPDMAIRAELGGCRYDTTQELLTTLIEQIFKDELSSIPFPTGDPATLYYYARTQRCRRDAWTTAQAQGLMFRTHYYLRPDLVGWDSHQLFNKAIYDVLMADPWFKEQYAAKVIHPSRYCYIFRLTAEDWSDIKPRLSYHFPGPYQGMLVNDMGFWNLIRDQLGDEAYEFLSVAGGYYSHTINWNAAEAFPYMVGHFSTADSVYKTIEGGFDQIAYVLAKEYLKQPDSMIWSQNALQTFEKMPPGSRHRYRLRIHNRISNTCWTVYTDAIVLAMPRRSLELLDQFNFFFDRDSGKELARNIASVIPEPSFKLLMGFCAPWWKEKFGAAAGESITDLPIRQCSYLGVDPRNGHSLFLSSYSDMQAVMFWAALELGERAAHEPFFAATRQFTTEEGLDACLATPAPAVMVDEAMAQVREVHGPLAQPIPNPYVTCFRDWTKDPFGGGYHAWEAGVDVRHVMPYMRKPEPGEAIHICGEAYSGKQGWVEGALCVAERMLQDHFELGRPSWLNKRYNLGW